MGVSLFSVYNILHPLIHICTHAHCTYLLERYLTPFYNLNRNFFLFIPSKLCWEGMAGTMPKLRIERLYQD